MRFVFIFLFTQGECFYEASALFTRAVGLGEQCWCGFSFVEVVHVTYSVIFLLMVATSALGLQAWLCLPGSLYVGEVFVTLAPGENSNT